VDLHQCRHTPWLASLLWPHSLVALCEALGIPKSRLGFAFALAHTLVGVAVAAVLLFCALCDALGIPDLRLDLHQRWLMPWSMSQLWPHIVAALCDALGIRVCVGIASWICISADTRLGWRHCCGLTLWSLSAMLWAFSKSRLGFASALAHALVGIAVAAVLLFFWRSVTLWAIQSTLGLRLDLHQRWLMPWSMSQLWPHILAALCDALGIRAQFGNCTWAFVATLRVALLRRFRHSSPLWMCAWICISAGVCLGQCRSCGSTFGSLSATLWALESIWICTWTCVSARSSLGQSRSYDLASLVTCWVFESALELRLGFCDSAGLRLGRRCSRGRMFFGVFCGALGIGVHFGFAPWICISAGSRLGRCRSCGRAPSGALGDALSIRVRFVFAFFF
jgi:hypothetical protein